MPGDCWSVAASEIWHGGVQEVEKGKALVPLVSESFGAVPFTVEDAREWQEWQEYGQDYNRYEYELDEDEEVRALALLLHKSLPERQRNEHRSCTVQLGPQ